MQFKKYGFAVPLALALTAVVGVASASALSFSAGIYPAQVQGATTGSILVNFTPTNRYECKSQSLGAGSMAGPAKKLTTTSVSEASCTQPAEHESGGPLKMNGCQLTFEAGIAGTYNGNVSVGPAGCGPVTMQTFYCNYQLDPSTLHGAAKLVNSGKETAVSVNIVGFDWENANKAFCGGSGTSGELVANWNLSAKNGGGGATTLNVVDSGLYLSGEAGGKTPKVESLSYPTVFGSSAASSFTLALGGTGTSYTCTSTTVHGEISAATSALSLAPEYASCNGWVGATKAAAKVFMNGCHYTLGVLNAGPPYTGTLGVACEGASPIEFKMYSSETYETVICTVKLAAQAGQPGVGLTNVTEGGKKGVGVNANVTTLAYERTGAACGGTKVGNGGNVTYVNTLLGS